LPPKFGLLTMVVDAALGVEDLSTQFVPVSIGYERVVEGETYERELQGGEKRKEDAAGLLKSSEMLRHRYGRINMQVGTILTLEDVANEIDLTLQPLTPPKRRALVTRLGNRVMDEINRVTAVTPGALCALVLLSHELRGLSHDEVVTRSERLLAVAIGLGARTSPTLSTPSGLLRTESLREALQMFVDAKLVEVSHLDQPPGNELGSTAGPSAVYSVVEKKRLVLDTSKNIIIHFFVERALVALALLVLGSPGAAREAVRQRVYDLSRLFKFEFRFRADAPFDAIFQETLERMQEDGEVTLQGDRVEPGPGRQGVSAAESLATYASILRNFLEGYRVAARCLGGLVDKPLGEKEMMRKALGVGQRMFLSGEMQRYEAVSKPIFENAFEAFADQGYLVRRDGKYDLGSTLTSQAAVDEVEDRIVSYLPDPR
jgi:glycerol-3-phosphate O-acyltransferase